ncbi:MAG: phospholipase/Carboxylesterase [Gemmatimonadetes bacterium]|jgi:phospholipase/carboxylesterase|nr:phospholipase/Carboxylesterase [Gemmatimonadota bacterium]
MGSIERTISRRRFILASGLAAGSVLFSRALGFAAPPRLFIGGRLSARVHPPEQSTSPGEYALLFQRPRPTLLYVPPSYRPESAAPFMLFLHGATQSGRRFLDRLIPMADRYGVVVLVPSSEDVTWDAIRGGFGVDAEHIDHALDDVFDQCAIDAKRVAIAGFSDGATYGLSLGLINGDLFTHTMAFSPGFILPGARTGAPKVFISHGRGDTILPIERCGRRIASALESNGYSVRFREFDGGHQLPADVLTDAATFAGWTAPSR